MEDERNTQHPHGGEAQEKAEQVEVKERGLLDTLLGRKKPEHQEKKPEEELVTGMEKVTVAEPEKAEVKKEQHEAGEKKESLFAKLHRTGYSSSSSSDEEEEVIDENGEVVKRKKKKSLKDKIKEKLPGHKDHEGEHHTVVPAAVPAPVETHAFKQDDDYHKAHKPAPVPVPAETHAFKQDDDYHKAYKPDPVPAPMETHAFKQDDDYHKAYKPAPVPAPVETHAYKDDDDHKAYIPAPAPAPVETHVHHNDNAVVVQKVEETPEEEKKGLLDKIKEKLPGGHKKPEDAAAPGAHAPAPHTEEVSSPDGKEKKQGLLGKIMDKIPGYNKGAAEEDHKAASAGEHKTSS